MSLRLRITLFVSIITLLVAVIVFISDEIILHESDVRFSNQVLKGEKILWQRMQTRQLEAMEQETSVILRDRGVRKALKSNKTDKLYELLTNTYNRLSSSLIISDLLIVKMNGDVLVSFPKENTISRSDIPLIKQAVSSKSITKGVVKNDQGHLVMAVVFPIYNRGKVIGAGVFSNGFKTSVNKFKEQQDSDVLIVNKDKKIEYASNVALLTQLNFKLPKFGTQSVSTADYQDKIYSIAVQPLHDVDNQAVAYLITSKDHTESYQAQKNSRVFALVTIIGAIGFALFLLNWYLSRSLSPINKVINSLEIVASGDLSLEIEITSNDEIGALQKATKTMISNLRDLLTNIDVTNQKLYGSSQDLLTVTQGAQGGVVKQKCDVEQVVQAIDDMTTTSQLIAVNVDKLTSDSIQVNQDAKQGQGDVIQVLESSEKQLGLVVSAEKVVQNLDESSGQINVILDQIISIADQTNLLALNAAIEAARAGEFGRGFAVVADEVRSLAGRTQKSTEEIRRTVDTFNSAINEAVDSMSKIREGVDISCAQTTKAGDALNSITESISVITEMVLEVSQQSKQQESAVSAISLNIETVDNVASENEMSFEKLHETEEGLLKLSEQLSKEINSFKV